MTEIEDNIMKGIYFLGTMFQSSSLFKYKIFLCLEPRVRDSTEIQ